MLFGVSLVHRDQALKAHDKGYELERQAASYCKKSRFFIVNMWKFFAKNTVLEKQTLMETRSRSDWANTVHMKIKSTKPKKDRSFLCCHALLWNIVIVNTITVCVFPEVYRKKLVFFFLLFLRLLMLLGFGHYCRRSHELWEIFVLLYFWPGWNKVFSKSFLEEKAWGDVIFLNQAVLDT